MEGAETFIPPGDERLQPHHAYPCRSTKRQDGGGAHQDGGRAPPNGGRSGGHGPSRTSTYNSSSQCRLLQTPSVRMLYIHLLPVWKGIFPDFQKAAAI